jgi:hypothetical protein
MRLTSMLPTGIFQITQEQKAAANNGKFLQNPGFRFSCSGVDTSNFKVEPYHWQLVHKPDPNGGCFDEEDTGRFAFEVPAAVKTDTIMGQLLTFTVEILDKTQAVVKLSGQFKVDSIAPESVFDANTPDQGWKRVAGKVVTIALTVPETP